MRYHRLFVIAGIFILALAGCGGTQAERPPAAPIPTTAPQAVVVTLVPAATGTPARSPAETADKTGGQAQGRAWRNCSLAPGWVGCDPQANTLAGRLVFIDPNLPGLVALDLSGEQAWTNDGKFELLDWSPGGDWLLAGLGNGRYRVYEADGRLIDQVESDQRPAWQPDGSFSLAGEVRSSGGDEARLEQGEDGALRLAVRRAGGEEQSFTLEEQQVDMLYRLVGWVPGTGQVLGQAASAGNAAMLGGARLFVLDIESGRRTNLEAAAPLSRNAVFEWRPGEPILALVETGLTEGRAPALALLDFTTGQLRFPLPEGIEVSAVDWHPSEERLAFAAAIWKQSRGFERPGIYLLDPRTGAAQRVTQPPNGAADGMPRWMPDGETLVFARRFDSGVLEIWAVRPADGHEWRIAAGLPAACDPDTGCDWQSWADAAPQR